MTTASATTPRPVMLVILDGFGDGASQEDNAVALAQTPNFDRLWESSPHAYLRTCGEDVGLPEGQMGNSEVGHLNIGAGRVVMQELPRITKAAREGDLAENKALLKLIDALKGSGGTCHLMGLVSPGGVHAHQDHIAALATIVAKAGVPVAVHAFTDGRDTAPTSGADYLRRLAAALPEGASIATVSGRYYAMDRDKRWDRVRLAYHAMTAGKGETAEDALAVLPAAYEKDVTDEFVKPTVIGRFKGFADGDGILAANFRADRIREILDAILQPTFDGFDRPRVFSLAGAAGMSPYSKELAPLMDTLFPKASMDDLLGDVVSRAGLKQLRMAETEKYPHVTYFLNGGREVQLDGEERILVPSPKVATYDLKPEMSAPELTEKAVAAIESGTFDMVVLNFANPDMVGHTGVLSAAVKAVEAVDAGLGKIADAVLAQGGALLVTADHGNCEMMRDPETGGPHTAHTLNRVPVLLAGSTAPSLHDGRLADLAPTMVALLGLEQPAAMTGKPLIDN